MSPVFTVTLLLLSQPDPSPPEMLQDAELTAVTFVDADRGWAVGDRGVIWHTGDGGRNWKLQNSGVTCRLEAVQFLDDMIGFAAGGWTQPYTHQTHGVLLRTRDGGRTWQNTPGLLVPGLTHVRFFNVRLGWALGDASPLFPSGIFRTDDGGRTFAPVPKGETLGWVTGDFRDERSGAVAGLGGILGLVTASEIRPTRTQNLGPRHLQRMILDGGTGGWLVGGGGLVLTTSDSGLTWTAPRGPLPDIAASGFDFRALAMRGSHVWITGAPGTRVLHSPDGGQTWQVFPTDHTAPLRGLWFIDEYRGWAVGALGAILHTRDGGRTWRAQRRGGDRVALLGVFSQPARMPLEVVAGQAGSEGYLTAMEIIGRHDQESGSTRPSDFTLHRRTHAAVVSAGGSAADTAWQFPLPEAGLASSNESILARWDRANDGQAAQRLEEHLVRRIRQWRPDVIVTEEVSPRGENPLAHLTNQVTLAAATKAGEPSAYPDQIAHAGLAAWKVKKVFTLLTEKQGLINLIPAQWTPRLGRSLAVQAEMGRCLLFPDVRISPPNIGLALLVDHLPQESGKRGLLSGIVLQPGGEARRMLSNPPPGDLEALSRLAQKRHNVEQLLDRIESNAVVGAGWIGQIGDLTKDLSSRHAGEILWQLGRKYQQVGKSEQAAEAFQLLLDKHAQHPLADAAALWLVQYYSSSEAAWRQRKQTKFDVRLATFASRNSRSEEQGSSDARNGEPAKPLALASVGTSSTAAPELNPVDRAGRAIAIANQIRPTRPALLADPALQFSLAAAARHAGQPRTAERMFQTLTSSGLQNVWAQNAAAEQWLVQPHENPPKEICSVVTAAAKPRLDGRLDDPTWQTAKAVSLKSPRGDDAAYPAAAVLAFDNEFLYIAVSCCKAPSVDYGTDTKAAESPRSADNDMLGRDRVMILVDVDRDYASFWTLTIDHRGWPAESCLGDASWNPQWFVAAGGNAEYWTVEAAVPLAELSQKKPQVRDIWAVGLQRVIPRTGLQSFSKPSAVDPRPEGFGLMVFE